MKQDKQIKQFDEDFEKYLHETDPVLHREALCRLLAVVDLGECFEELVENKEDIEKFFVGWQRATEFEECEDEKSGLEKLGELSCKYYKKKKYEKLHDLYFGLAFRHIAEFLDLKNRDDFDEITQIDLF